MKVPGFKAAAAAAELRYKGRLDLGLIAADREAVAAGVFTRNLVKAAPVLWSMDQTARGSARAVLVNAGQANACTGPEGAEAARASAVMVARELGCRPDEILLASTGVIGEQLNMPALEKALPKLVADLGEDNLPLVSQAMITTDTRPKTSSAEFEINGTPAVMTGMAKGSGMIQPNMATMLSFILTDAVVSPEYLASVLRLGAARTFNRVTVDGDTSTNDCVLALASGLAGGPRLDSEESPGAADFEAALTGIMSELAYMLAADAEGGTKVVRVIVSGAVDSDQATRAALTVANSPLVKTALFGEDANWGRIMAALGRSGAGFDPDRVDIFVNEAPLALGGRAAPDLGPAEENMRRKEIDLKIDLGSGRGLAEVLTSDLSLDYVKINAHYRS